MGLSLFFLLISAIECANAVLTRQSLAQHKSHKEFCKTVINFNNSWYSRGERRNISGIPADLSVHWKSGKVFFTLISEDMKMNLQMLHPSGEFETVKVAGLGQSTTVDNLNDIVYLATDNGVYKYKEDSSIELFTALGEDVMYLAVSSDGLDMYIATWPQNRVHKITNDGQKRELFPMIPNGHGLVIDTRNNIYFVATKTSYVLKRGYTIPIKIKYLPSDKMTGVFVSRSDEVFAMDENSNLYSVDPDTTSAKHIGCFNVSGVNAFAMDASDNVIIGVKGAILKFRVLDKNPCPPEALADPKFYAMPTVPIVTKEMKTKKTISKKGKRHNGKKRKVKKTTTTTTTTTLPTSSATASTEASEEEEEEA